MVERTRPPDGAAGGAAAAPPGAEALEEPAPGRRRTNRGSPELRRRLVDAAIAEFAASGFTGASTRAIARRADAHQPQINYHFASKDDLWKACLEHLVTELDREVAAQLDRVDGGDPAAEFAAVVRGLVVFSARRPELNRIMIQEATAPSERLDWLVTTHLQRRCDVLAARWTRAQQAGVAAPLDPRLLYHTLVGASALLYANAPEARRLGVDPDDPEVVTAHADALIAMFLPGFDAGNDPDPGSAT